MSIELSIHKELFTATGKFTLSADLKINQGEMVAFYGPSGVGKTTMLRIISGLTEPDEGFLNVDDEVWVDSSRNKFLPPQKREVGYVFQDYALFPNMTVKENIGFAQSKPDKKHVKELLEIFGLGNLQHRKPSMLSGGQRQRVALARALARRPKVLLLDEPLSALDQEMRATLQDEILQIHKRWEITTILVSHDITEVFKLCDRTVVFQDGKIIKDGNPFDIFNQNKTSGKVQLIAEVLKIENEGLVNVLTLLIGNSPVKIAVCNNPDDSYKPGDKVLVASKAFNPIIQKI